MSPSNRALPVPSPSVRSRRLASTVCDCVRLYSRKPCSTFIRSPCSHNASRFSSYAALVSSDEAAAPMHMCSTYDPVPASPPYAAASSVALSLQPMMATAASAEISAFFIMVCFKGRNYMSVSSNPSSSADGILPVSDCAKPSSATTAKTFTVGRKYVLL